MTKKQLRQNSPIKHGIIYIQNNILPKSVILSDSKSTLHLISKLKPKHYKHIMFEIQALLYTLTNQWTPSHKNIYRK